jgi:hypothetical protein
MGDARIIAAAAAPPACARGAEALTGAQALRLGAHAPQRAAEAHVALLAAVAGAAAAQRPARRSRKSARSGVGRPVLPFCAPPW